MTYRAGLLVILLLGALCAQAAGNWPLSPQSSDQLRDALQARLEGGVLAGETLLQRERVISFYQQRDNRPAWFDSNGIVAGAGELLSVLDEAQSEGLMVGYHRAALQQLMAQPAVSDEVVAPLDILLTDAFIAYSLDVRRGRFTPSQVDSSWHIAPSDSNVGRMLRYALESHSVLAALHSMPPYERGYRRLRRALRDYLAVAAQGGWPQLPSGEKLQLGSVGARVVLLRQRLRSSGDLPQAMTGHEQRFDSLLQLAVRRFQARHGLLADGVVGEATRTELNVPVEQRIAQLEVNMERWRWLPRHLENRYLLVNMTGFRLDVMEDDLSVMHMRVIIGKEYRQTPVFDSDITQVIFNPSWYVPTSIFHKELLPHLLSDSSYLARHDMSIQDGGDVLDPQKIDWTQYESARFPYTVRQEPGAGNPLGKVKFVLPNHYRVYLHDTSQPHLFAQRDRTFSHGCIRLEKPLALARYLLERESQQKVGEVDRYLAKPRTVVVKLSKPLPIYLVYWTAWVDEDGQVQFRDDIYSRDSKMLALLAQQPRQLLSQNSSVE